MVLGLWAKTFRTFRRIVLHLGCVSVVSGSIERQDLHRRAVDTGSREAAMVP